MRTPTNIPETPMGETEQDSFFESKEKFQQQLQYIFQTILRLTGPDHFDQLCQWMEYKQYCTIDDFYENSYDDLENFDTKGPATEYKWKGKTNHLSPIVAQLLKCFVKWMTHEDRPYELHDDFLATLTRDSYLKFRHKDTQSFSASSPSHHESSKLKTSFPGEFKHQTTSESQTALNNFKNGTKRDASVYPIFKNEKYYDTFQRSFLANLKAQGLYDVADPDHDPENGDIYEKGLFKGKQSFVYSVLVTSLQTEKGRELVKEFEGDARSIILKLHHYHTKSNVLQHDIITLTTDITNLTLNDSWKGTVRQFLSHFKEKLRLLDSLVPVSDQLPETTRIPFLQRAVQQNHDLSQIHVMDSVWRFKADSTDALTFDTYYNLLWDAAHQYDLHQLKKGPQRKAFFSQQEEINDDAEYATAEEYFSTEWDPSVLDYTHPSGDGEPPWSNDLNERITFDPYFDEFGNYTQRTIQTLNILDDSSSTLTPCPTFMANQHEFRTYQHAVNHEAPDYEKFRPYFGWVNVDTVQKTMEQFTQWGVSLPNTFPVKRHLKSRNPAINIPRRHEAVATDTVFSDTPAVDSGVKQAQVFVGRDTLVADAYPMKSGKQFVNTLEDNIRRQGAMDKLLSDSAKTEISNKVMDNLRAYHISNWHSEPYHQNQNPAEWRYRTIKSWTNTVMNRSGAPANCWLLCLIYMCYLLNHIACSALDGKIPLLALTGITPDISIILLFTFYQPVFFATYDQHFPSESEERLATG